MKEENNKDGKAANQSGKKNSSALRQKFMDEIGFDLLEEYSKVIKGKDDFKSKNVKARESAFELVKSIISSVGDTHALEIATTANVIDCIKQGSITFLEAKQLMDMLSIKSDMDDVKKLLEAVNQMNGNSIGNG